MRTIDALLAEAPATLVIAPHPDDEALGCGGLIAALAERKARIKVVFVTDGGASHLGSTEWSRSRLAACREEEAKDAVRRLGLPDDAAIFLRLPDADMPVAGSPDHRRALNALVEIIGSLRPELSLLPWRRDPHRDHRDCWSLATEALRRAAAEPEILEYAIWLDEIGQDADQPAPGEAEPVELEIAGFVAAKRAAVAAHVSQHAGLITDDPTGFHLTEETVARLTGPTERYWRPCAGS